jgi:hypothetical protein
VNCRTCGYALFNLTEPRCPECNTPFDVTNYTFRPGTVKFVCSYCGESYEGDDAQGLPANREFPGAKCSKLLSVSTMCVVPMAANAVGTLNRPVAVPWEEPGQMGLVRRWWKTVTFASRDPVLFYRVLRHVDDVKKAIGFAAVCTLFNTTWFGALMTLMLLDNPAVLRMGIVGPSSGFTLQLLLAVIGIVVPIVTVLTTIILLLTVGLHVGILLSTSNARSFASTVIVVCYSTAPTAFGWIPVIGPLISLSLGFRLVVEGVMVFHRTTQRRSIAACLFGAALVLGTLVGLGYLLALAD